MLWWLDSGTRGLYFYPIGWFVCMSEGLYLISWWVIRPMKSTSNLGPRWIMSRRKGVRGCLWEGCKGEKEQRWNSIMMIWSVFLGWRGHTYCCEMGPSFCGWFIVVCPWLNAVFGSAPCQIREENQYGLGSPPLLDIFYHTQSCRSNLAH